MSDDLVSLRAELATLQQENEEQARLLGISGSKEARLLAELAECKKDAARYRFLRHNFESGFDRGKRDKTGRYAWWYNNRGELSGEADDIKEVPDLGDLIDDALAKAIGETE